MKVAIQAARINGSVDRFGYMHRSRRKFLHGYAYGFYVAPLPLAGSRGNVMGDSVLRAALRRLSICLVVLAPHAFAYWGDLDSSSSSLSLGDPAQAAERDSGTTNVSVSVTLSPASFWATDVCSR
jgi:hypothetical protein